jgi:hypothetical protein
MPAGTSVCTFSGMDSRPLGRKRWAIAITAEQAKNFAEALVRGEPAASKIVRTVLKDRIRELV